MKILRLNQNRQEAKKKISALIEKYRRIADTGKISLYNEAQTRNEFIEPLFEFLGWDMRNLSTENEVTTEENISGKRVDLAFRINDIPKFFLEAKSIKTDLDIEAYAKQAIQYSWHKGVSWSVLTDFESVKVFNAQAQSRLLSDKLVFEISFTQYLDDFERLWLLSKESFAKNKLDEYAEKYGKKIKKQTVNDRLFNDFKKAREIMTKSFHAWNPKVDQETLDEGVQRILDRLVFIRVLEDKKLEPPTLWQIVREQRKDGQKQIFQMLIKKFRELDEIYNSNLFTKHSCEEWEEYDDALTSVIKLLYGNDVYEYDFSEIPADILGGVYENYLGYIAQNPIDNKKEIKAQSRQKRKEQGIYYTPKYIVDYIVKNTLGRKLKEINSVHELNKIKVLDPACGSGSFLTQALESINNKYKEFGNTGDQYTKSSILLNNIYGVDLDPQATELAKLNLLVDALDKKGKLPNLTANIRAGNSLISGDVESLEKYFGKNWRDQSPFNWQGEFKEVFNDGGFDVIIGNPPYVDVRKIDSETKNYIFNNFSSAKNRTNLFAIFIERGLNLLRTGGRLGFIVPNTILTHSSFKELRNFILSNFTIETIVELGTNVFKDAQVDTVILVFKKGEYVKNHQIKIMLKDDLGIRKHFTIKQSDFDKDAEKRFSLIDPKLLEIMTKIEAKSSMLGKFYHGFNGINPGNQRDTVVTKNPNLSDKRFKKVIDGKNISRYSIVWGGEWVCYDRSILERPRDEKIFLASPKIMLQKIGIGLVAGYDIEQLYALINTTILVEKEKAYDPLFILAVINSRLLNFYYKSKFLGVQIKTEFLENLPIPNAREVEQDKIVKRVRTMLELNKELQLASANTDKHNALKREIEKLDQEIDEAIYKLYGLTDEEIKTIEK